MTSGCCPLTTLANNRLAALNTARRCPRLTIRLDNVLWNADDDHFCHHPFGSGAIHTASQHVVPEIKRKMNHNLTTPWTKMCFAQTYHAQTYDAQKDYAKLMVLLTILRKHIMDDLSCRNQLNTNQPCTRQWCTSPSCANLSFTKTFLHKPVLLKPFTHKRISFFGHCWEEQVSSAKERQKRQSTETERTAHHANLSSPRTSCWGCIVTCPWQRSNKDCSAATARIALHRRSQADSILPWSTKGTLQLWQGNTGSCLAAHRPPTSATNTTSLALPPSPENSGCVSQHAFCFVFDSGTRDLQELEPPPGAILCEPWRFVSLGTLELVARQDVRTWSKMANFMNADKNPHSNKNSRTKILKHANLWMRKKMFTLGVLE